MGKLFNSLAFLLILLFILGVSWLGYRSYQHMKEETAIRQSKAADNTDEVTSTEWDEEEDLLEDEEVEDVMDEPSSTDEEVSALLAESEEDGSEADDIKEKEGDEMEDGTSGNAEDFNKMVNLSPSELYYVIVGSFTIAENAEKEAITLKKKGYTGAETVQFASTKYLSVSAGKFRTQQEARQLAENVKKDLNIDVYVHKRRWE